MIKPLLLLCLCACGVLGGPLQSYEVFDDVENDAEIIDAAVPLRGTGNLHEKRVPVIRLTIPAGYLGLYGTQNLAERSQIPRYQQDDGDIALMAGPGSRNLEEKAIPEAVIARIRMAEEERRNARGYDVIGSRHPKSEVEKINV